jgi:hypothetical protein
MSRENPKSRQEFSSVNIASMQVSMASGWIESFTPMEHAAVVENNHLPTF